LNEENMPANQAGRPILLRPWALAVLALTIAASMPSLAAQRNFVRSDGADTGTCSFGAPCRSFNYAIAQTSAGGELIILDTAGYAGGRHASVTIAVDSADPNTTLPTHPASPT
jgi:hypothetical protein